MKKSMKLIAFICVLITFATFSANILSYGYFYAGDKNIVADGTFTPDGVTLDPNVIKVTKAAEFKKAVTDSTYNSHDGISGGSTNRKTILLLNNITMPNAIRITADVNLDLGGHTLYTDGNDLSIDHNYIGNIAIYNGAIECGATTASNLNIRVPRAVVTVSANLINVKTNPILIDNNALISEVFDSISDSLEDDWSSRAYYQNAQELSKNRECYLHGTGSPQGVDHNCTFICRDVDLPKGYYDYAVNIEYISSQPSVLSNGGDFNPLSVPTGDYAGVTLTAKVTFGGVSLTKNYNIHGYRFEDELVRKDVAKIQIVEYLERYYRAAQGANPAVYYIPQATTLPKLASDGVTEILYRAVDSGGVILDTTAVDKTGATTPNTYFRADIAGVNTNDFVLTLDDKVKTLRITLPGMLDINLAVSGADTASIKDNYTIALAIAKRLYTNPSTKSLEFVVKDKAKEEATATIYNDYTAHALTISPSTEDRAKHVTNFSYKLTSNIDQTYSLGLINGGTVNHLFVANKINPPTVLQSVNVRMTFTFDTPTDKIVSINIPVRYEPAMTSDGNIINEFVPYYYFFNKKFEDISGGYTYDTFYVPFNYEDGEPVYFFDVYNHATGQPDTTISTQVLEYKAAGSNTITTVSLADVIAMPSASLRPIVETGTAKWKISFNTANMFAYNVQLDFVYRYKFANANGDFPNNVNVNGDSWSGVFSPYTKSPFISKCIAPGILKKTVTPNNDYMDDANLYKYIYDNARPDKSIPEYSPSSDRFILTDWLEQDFLAEDAYHNFTSIIDNDNNKLKISSYAGIQYVKKVKVLKLTESGIDVRNLEYVAQMSSVEELSVYGCGLKDFNKTLLNLPTGGDSGLMKLFPRMPNLKILHLEKNPIFYYKELLNCPSLKSVCVWDNAFNTEGIIDLYGTNGILNMQVFMQLTSRGVKVNNVAEGSGYTRATGVFDKALDAINSLVYRKVIYDDEDIMEAYESITPDQAWYSTSMGTGTKKDEVKFLVDENNRTTTKTFTVRYIIYIEYWSGLKRYHAVMNVDFEYEVIRIPRP